MAEDSAAKSAEPKAEKQHGMLGLSLAGKGFGALLAAWTFHVSYSAFTFFAFALLPAFLAALLDRSSGRCASKTVAACNMLGASPYLAEIGVSYDPVRTALQIMYDYHTWLFVYSYALLGWAAAWLGPQLAALVFLKRAEEKASRLERRQGEIVDEWGLYEWKKKEYASSRSKKSFRPKT